RPRALDQARGERGRRGLHGGLPGPPVPGGRMNAGAVTLADLRTIDLFDDLSDEELREWVAVAELRHADANEVLHEHGEDVSGLILLLEGTARALLVEG